MERVEAPALADRTTGVLSATAGEPRPSRRAIVCFVEEHRHLIQQVLALRLSWRYAQSPDTDLVVMGPEEVLARLPADLIKIPQRPAADDPVWQDYRYINAITSLNAAGAEQLDRYSHILRTDVDCFMTPAWNQFYPTAFTFGTGGYANDEEVRQRLRDIAADYGLVHRGITNVGATWYGPTVVVRRACAVSEMLAKHILTHYFTSEEEGQWPGWYRGVTSMYSGDIAVNHCARDAQRSELLDAASDSAEAITRYPHIHCWATEQTFSKHMTIIPEYCLALSLQSLEAFA